MLGQSYSLTCGVTGAANLNPSITYQWTNNNGAQIGTNEVLSFASFSFSDAGQYTCRATVSSPYLNNDITMTNTHDVRIQSKFGYILVHVCRCILWATVDEHVTAYLV
jgi:PKD repeat protein